MWVRVKALGSGSFGVVCLGKLTDNDGLDDGNLNLPPVFAVKSIELSHYRILQKDRELLAELDGSPGVIRCYGADVSEEKDTQLYNVFLEYATGGNLRDYIYSSSGLCLDDIRWITKSLLLGLRDIHSRGIVHCDIKPDNILVVNEEGGKSSIKIADFGFGKRLKDQKKKRKRCNLRGTTIYMAPESILHGEFGYGVDIWALGCCVFEMIVREHISNCKGDLVRVGDNLQRVIKLPKGLPKVAENFLKKTWKTNPQSRWSAEQLLLHPFVDIED